MTVVDLVVSKLDLGIRKLVFGILVVLVASSCLVIVFPGALGLLALVPANLYSAHLYLWTLLTCAVVEPNPLSLALSALAVRAAGAGLAGVNYPVAPLLSLLVASALAAAGVSFLVSIARYVALGADEATLFSHYYSAGVVAVPMTLALAAHAPTLQLLPLPFSARQGPALLLLAHAALAVLGTGTSMTMTLVAAAVAWQVLRVHTPHLTDEQRANLEPARLLSPSLPPPPPPLPLSVPQTASAPAATPEEDAAAERRRQAALAALDEQLKAMGVDASEDEEEGAADSDRGSDSHAGGSPADRESAANDTEGQTQPSA